MGKLCFLQLLCLLLCAAAAKAKAIDEAAHQNHWHVNLNDLGKEKIAHLHFYFHDTLSGKNPSAMVVARAPTTQKSKTFFGSLMMADDPLTEGPEPTSKLVGRAQGLYGSAGQQQIGLIMAMSFGFRDGPYNGSTLSVMGWNSASHPVREISIVGGTGVFRFARGIAVAKTYWINVTSGDAIVEYNVTAIHY